MSEDILKNSKMQPADSSSARPSRAAILAALALIVLVQGGVRLWLIANSKVIAQDGSYYLEMARRLPSDPAGAMRQYVIHPGYSAAVAGAHWLAGGGADSPEQWEQAGRAVSLVAGVGGVVAMWIFGGIIFRNWRVALAGAMLVGLGRKFAALGADVLGDSLALCFQMWSLVAAVMAARCLVRAGRRAIIWAAMAGAMAGMAYLVRPEGLVVLPIAMLLWLAAILARPRRWTITLGSIAVAIVAAGVFMGPYMLTIGAMTAKLKMSEFSIPAGALALPANAFLGCATVYPVESSAAVRIVGRFFEAQQPILASLTCVYLLLWVACRPGRFEALRRVVPHPSRSGWIVIISTWVLIGPFVVLRYRATGAMSHRYLILPAAMMACMPGGALAAMVAPGRAALERKNLRRLADFLLPAATVIVAAVLLVHTLRPLHEKQLFAREAGLWLAGRLEKDDMVLTDQFFVKYYSRGGNVFVLDENSLRRFLAGRADLTKHKYLRLLLESRRQIRAYRFVALTDPSPGGISKDTASLLDEFGYVGVAEFPYLSGGRAKKTIYVYEEQRGTGL